MLEARIYDRFMVQVTSPRPNQAALELCVSLTGPAGEKAASNSGSYFSADDITAGGILQTGFPPVSEVTQQYESTVQFQHMSGQVGFAHWQTLTHSLHVHGHSTPRVYQCGHHDSGTAISCAASSLSALFVACPGARVACNFMLASFLHVFGCMRLN